MIILASASPRRKELLSRICDFEVRPSRCDEDCAERDPDALVRELSLRKARAAEKDADKKDVIVAADTVVYFKDAILGKPRDRAEAYEMLRALSGRAHTVFTGVTVIKDGEAHTFCDRTRVTFYRLSEELIREYVESGEPLDKAGSYGIQGKGCLLVKRIEGDFFNVMGLPVARLYRLLTRIGGI